jgi:cell division inhibitor SulA/protein ImuA
MALADILARPDIWRGTLACAPLPTVASGFAALDEQLPGGGWPRGALAELLVDGVGLGELSLLTPALVGVRQTGGWALLVAPPYPLHAPAWAAAGIDLAHLAVVSPASERDALWAMEQALASGAPRAVVGWASHADARVIRRLQIAAVAGGALAFLFRPSRAAPEASAAPLRLCLAGAADDRLAVRILKRRGPPAVAPLMLALSRPVRPRRHEYSVAGHQPVRAAALA